jgi:hypothetical protein
VILYDNLSSGNGYKVRLLLAQLSLPFERIEYDIDRGETRTPAISFICAEHQLLAGGAQNLLPRRRRSSRRRPA